MTTNYTNKVYLVFYGGVAYIAYLAESGCETILFFGKKCFCETDYGSY